MAGKYKDTKELVCQDCGIKFLFRREEQEEYARKRWDAPKRCVACRRKKKERTRLAQEAVQAAHWQKKKAAEKAEFEQQLTAWPVEAVQNIHPEAGKTLYILGNGFDLMHRVSSSYYGFRDSLGKRSSLRFALETYLTAEDIWSDFEAALALFNMQGIAGGHIVDSWLDTFDAYGEDAQAADYYLAIESAASPMMTIQEELPRRFRRWLESLKIGTADRPLQNLIQDGKVLCFNYTEFMESLYGVSTHNVCYIHGCRRNKSADLVLGHLPGASDAAFLFRDRHKPRYKNARKQHMLDMAQENVVYLVAQCDDELTKHSDKIIANHKAFFEDLGDIQYVVVVGHSYSQVDWAYFREVAAQLSGKTVHWYFGCHSLRDLGNLEKLVSALGLDSGCLSLFRTDEIETTPFPGNAAARVNKPKDKELCISDDGQNLARLIDNRFQICSGGVVNYEMEPPERLHNACFSPSGEQLFVIIRGCSPGILLFGKKAGHWGFVSELRPFPNQDLLNNRLRGIYITEEIVRFVYNNYVRTFRLSDGTIAESSSQRNAGSLQHEGENVTARFLKVK